MLECERRPQLWDVEEGGKLCTLGRTPASLSLRFPVQEDPQAGQVLCRFRGAEFRMTDISERIEPYTPPRGNC